MLKKAFILGLSSILLSGCMAAGDHRKAVQNTDDKLTVGVVQKEIKEGMSGADVATALGSPNMVTKDKSGAETWIYDKVSTEYVYSSSSGGVSSLILGTGAVIGAAGGSYNSSSGASSQTQRTLTIIIKFIEGEVSEYTYHASSF
jgi:outer membrane protein assembly factor BamE (lipoprotein component of BamABCDE complex)